LAWESSPAQADGTAGKTVHYLYEPGTFVPVAQAMRHQPIRLLAQPNYEAAYDIDQDPLWTHTPQALPIDVLTWYQCDHLGTPQELTDHNGQLAWSAQYKAWGDVKEQRSEWALREGLTNPIRFQGQYHDHETGLHYNRYRYYDPRVGRFISKDPISYAGGLNLYAYAPNPTGWVDPLGLSSTSDGVGNSVPLSDFGVPERAKFTPKTDITTPYKRSSKTGPTKGQTSIVQGLPCVRCGTKAPKMVADHKDALVVEYYRTGENDVAAQTSLSAVQPHCPICSRQQGGHASTFAKDMKNQLGIN
ncbi:RHS repeat-associated core domain-containing protein, partial [Pseudomonas weihenstephanensis]|uniref:RHS repeat-associated core domain-containing protein n=1 Tax=Pseudomonas weihenstephanensis TaxID=1608994 RepID=UPI0006543F7D